MTEAEALAALRGDDPLAAGRAEAELWALWHRSGRAEVDALLAEGIAALEQHELAAAERTFTDVITRAPDFAEGWNKRATTRYVAGEYRTAIADCAAALALTPHHFGALSGQGLCHLALGETRAAARLFRRALGVHPRLAGARRSLARAVAELVEGNGHAPGADTS